MTATAFDERFVRVRQEMEFQGVDAMVLSVGADLPYLTGYQAMASERLTMLVVPADGDATLVIPRLEAPRVTLRDEFSILPWGETDDPISIVDRLIGDRATVAIGDTTWARFVVDLVDHGPTRSLRNASTVMSVLRAVKSPDEIDRLRAASHAVDRIAARLQAGEIDLVGRTEAEVSAELGRQIIEEGHDVVNFAIVAAGENAASPHHHAGQRVIRAEESVLCDFGGTMVGDDGVGYCSDITRCVYIGAPTAEFAEMYDVLFAAQAASVEAATVGRPAEEIDQIGRAIISDAGYGDYFMHRTGHGIGVEAHEEPYIVAGNTDPLVPGNAFSIEPGIYIEGKFGARLEDIVVAAEVGPDPLNEADHQLALI